MDSEITSGPDDRQAYEDYMASREKAWEDACLRCGNCCGAFEDPCSHLKKDAAGQYYCDSYDSRLGLQKSTGGVVFRCVPIRSILHKHWKNDHLCVYKKKGLQL